MEIPAKEVFKKVLVNAIKNTIGWGIGILIIVFIGDGLGLRTIGLVLGGIFALVILITLLPVIFSFAMGLFTGVLTIADAIKGNSINFKEQGYLWAGTLVQLVENGIYLCYILYLYRVFLS